MGNALAVFAALLAAWQLVIWDFPCTSFMLPSVLAVARAVATHFSSLAAAFAITAAEAAGGLVASIFFGVIIALFFAQSRWVRRMLYPYTLLLQTVPIVAIAPLILMWVGAGPAAVGFIAFIISLAPIIANHDARPHQRGGKSCSSFLMYNASRGQLLFKCGCRTPCLPSCRCPDRERYRRDWCNNG